MITLIYVGGTTILVICLILIYYLIKRDRLNKDFYKIEMCEQEIDAVLNNEEENVLRLISIINRELDLDIKEFERVKKLKTNRINNVEKDKLLSETYEEIKKIYVDNKELSEIKRFDGIMNEISRSENTLISLRTLYNKCASSINFLIKRFPYNLIAKIKKIKFLPLYEGKELHELIDKELNNLVI